MAKRSKGYLEQAAKIDADNLYTPLQAAKLAKETASSKFDATVEVAVRLGVDPRKADQMVRGTVPTAPARPLGSSFSPLVRRLLKQRQQEPTSSVQKI